MAALHITVAILDSYVKPRKTGEQLALMEKKSTENVELQTCFIVMAGLQSLSSSSIDRHTVPDGYTFG